MVFSVALFLVYSWMGVPWEDAFVYCILFNPCFVFFLVCLCLIFMLDTSVYSILLGIILLFTVIAIGLCICLFYGMSSLFGGVMW